METEITPLPYFFIDQDVVDQRTAAFVNEKHSVLSSALGKPDTKNIWYSRDHISKLLDEIDHAGGDGLRVFFGTYEASHQFAGQLCLVMNPTRANANGGHDNVVLENEPDFADRSSLSRSAALSPGQDMFTERGFNYGSPCPPFCD